MKSGNLAFKIRISGNSDCLASGTLFKAGVKTLAAVTGRSRDRSHPSHLGWQPQQCTSARGPVTYVHGGRGCPFCHPGSRLQLRCQGAENPLIFKGKTPS